MRDRIKNLRKCLPADLRASPFLERAEAGWIEDGARIGYEAFVTTCIRICEAVERDREHRRLTEIAKTDAAAAKRMVADEMRRAA